MRALIQHHQIHTTGLQILGQLDEMLQRSFPDDRTGGVGPGDYGVGMARPAALPPEAEPRPALLSPHTPRAIRDALVGSERAEFEYDYQQAMTEAARTLDL
ncbi:MAG: DUF6247 family protein, partial [Pseudonocardiaceae bacterium]